MRDTLLAVGMIAAAAPAFAQAWWADP